jgi:hypothetical protein
MMMKLDLGSVAELVLLSVHLDLHPKIGQLPKRPALCVVGE